jgi:hypothetical protein
MANNQSRTYKISGWKVRTEGDFKSLVCVVFKQTSNYVFKQHYLIEKDRRYKTLLISE